MKTSLSINKKIKYLLISCVVVALSILYILNEYKAHTKYLSQSMKNEMVLYYNIYTKIVSPSIKQKNILIQNIDETIKDELQRQKEYSNITPLMMKKDDIKPIKYTLTFKILEQDEIINQNIKNLFLDLKENSYTITFQDNSIILVGKVLNDKYLLITKQLSNLNKTSSLLNALFVKFLFVGLFNIILFLYFIQLVKGYEKTKEALYNEFEKLKIDTKKVAFEDTLTGAATRLKFDETLKDLVNIASRFQEQKFTAIMIDIDNFKKVNDTYGHDYGDIVLQEVARVVKENIRATDTFARWGGEEFVILSPMNNLKDSLNIANKIRKLIANLEFEKLDHITCSFGLAEFRKEDTELSIMKRADELLYKAKQNGKNRVEYQLV